MGTDFLIPGPHAVPTGLVPDLVAALLQKRMTPQTVNAYYNTSFNEIVFPAGILQPADQYASYEPMPGFFIDGRFTLGENIGDVGGLSIAYRAYKIALNGEEAPVIDGLTGDQRFYLGFAQVWQGKIRNDALVTQLKSDPHSPAEFRANGTVRNQDPWYTAFDVKEGDAYHEEYPDVIVVRPAANDQGKENTTTVAEPALPPVHKADGLPEPAARYCLPFTA